MKLFYREIGEGEPIVILHGLYGSSDNWMSVGRGLASSYRVILVDQRNHGQSPHSNSHSYNDLAIDLRELFTDLSIKNAVLMGHSMGGKAAMLFAIMNPEAVSKLIVVDISPVSYRDSVTFTSHEREHANIISALLSIDVNALSSRSQADELLSRTISDFRIRQFLLKNLKRDHNDRFTWALNLDALSHNLPMLMDSILADSFNGKIETPTLFVKGEKSPYIEIGHEQIIREIFTRVTIASIPNAGHWVHAEQPDLFFNAITRFLSER